MPEQVASFRVLGVRVDAVQIPDVIDIMKSWIRVRSGSRFVAVTGMHGVVEAQGEEELKRIYDDAGLVVPDGMPLVWIGRRRGFHLPRRVYGPELMMTFLSSAGRGCSHYLYGGAPGVAEDLAEVMRQKFNVSIAGTFCPPFRSLSETEADEVVRSLNESRADVIWVGLSTPKQERWMHEFRDRLEAPVLVGVGAAFDFLTGRTKTAPRWMQEHGLEWLYRLISEPRRLWRRYLVGGTKFLWWNLLEAARLRSFD